MTEEKPNKTKRQVFVPSTAHTRGRQTTINLPKQCRDVPYRRYIMADGRFLFVPAACTAGHPENSQGTPVIPRRDGKRTYAPIPADAAGWRYRRIINQLTSVIELTPIYRPRPITVRISARRPQKRPHMGYLWSHPTRIRRTACTPQ